MKVTTEELGQCEVLLTIEAEPVEEQNLLKKAARSIAKQVQIPGFRPGKAPYRTVVRRYGLEAIQQEALNQSSEKIVVDALEEAELEPQAPLSFDEVSWDPLTIKVKVAGEPVVDLGGYREIRLEPEPVEVSDDDVAESLAALQEQHATWSPVERPAEVGDLITMSVVEKDGDEIVAENESVEYELVDPEDVEEEEDEDDIEAPDFTTPLLGLSAGESKSFVINYPDDWEAERYAGKEITFEVEVGSVKEKELDPLDDDFAQSVGDFETLDDLKERIRSNIRQGRTYEADKELGSEVLDEIMEDATLEWAPSLEEYRLDQEVERVEAQLKQSNLTLDSYLQVQGKTSAEFREELREQVVENLKMGLVMNKLVELEQLDVSQVDILEHARAMADYMGAGDQFWQSILSSQQSQARIASEILTNKVFERLAAIAKGEAPEPGEEPEIEPEPEPDADADADADASTDDLTESEGMGEVEAGEQPDAETTTVEAEVEEDAAEAEETV